MAYNAPYGSLESSTHLQVPVYVPPLQPQAIHASQDTLSSYPPGYSASALDLHELETLRGRTPSPTPSEQRALRNSGPFSAFSKENIKRLFTNKKNLVYLAIFAAIIVLVVLLAVYNKQIVDALTPVTKWLHDRPGGWLVPIAILFVVSFPPLFGHEIIAILCGVVWGLWIGFGIVAAGTLLGEIANYYVFKYWCTARGEKHEKKSIFYGCLARVIRQGGFIIAVIVRLSAIPAHFTTTIFATCGMNIFVFILATLVSMPKQLVTVYIGVVLEQSADGTETDQSRKITNIVLIVTIVITTLFMSLIRALVEKVKPDVIYQRRKARQAKLEAEQSSIGLGHSRNHSDAASYGGHSESENLLA